MLVRTWDTARLIQPKTFINEHEQVSWFAQHPTWNFRTTKYLCTPHQDQHFTSSDEGNQQKDVDLFYQALLLLTSICSPRHLRDPWLRENGDQPPPYFPPPSCSSVMIYTRVPADTERQSEMMTARCVTYHSSWNRCRTWTLLNKPLLTALIPIDHPSTCQSLCSSLSYNGSYSEELCSAV